jgi:transcriptional repressor NrdR
VKHDGRREPFDRGKLERSIGRAAKGRGASPAAVHGLATEVAQDVLNELGEQPVVTAGQIASEILRSLRRRDHIGFLRYASTAKGYLSREDYEFEAVALRRDE